MKKNEFWDEMEKPGVLVEEDVKKLRNLLGTEVVLNALRVLMEQSVCNITLLNLTTDEGVKDAIAAQGRARGILAAVEFFADILETEDE